MKLFQDDDILVRNEHGQDRILWEKDQICNMKSRAFVSCV